MTYKQSLLRDMKIPGRTPRYTVTHTDIDVSTEL